MAGSVPDLVMAASATYRAFANYRKEMPMTHDQIALVQTSFTRLAPQADAVAQAFYARLFQIDPALRAMFPADLGPQRAKLMQMLAVAVQGLSNPQALLPLAATLGQRHAHYGVRAAHYDTVGQALLDTLRAGLGADFTPVLEQAWRGVYSSLAGAMQAGAAAREKPALAA